MAFLTTSERGFLRAISSLGYCNPFLPERIEYEREALGPDFVEAEAVWSLRVDDPDTLRSNPVKITERVEALVGKLRERLTTGAAATEPELLLYEDAILWLLYHRYGNHFYEAIVQPPDHKPAQGRSGFSAKLRSQPATSLRSSAPPSR